MKISTKLYISFWLTVVFFIFVSLFFIFQTYSLYNLTIKIHNHPLVASKTLLKANFKIVAIQDNLRKTVHSIMNVTVANQTILVNERQVYKYFNALEEHFADNKQELFKLIKLFDDWRPIRNEIIRLHANGQTEQAIIINKDKSVQQVVKIERAFKKLTDMRVAKTNIFLDSFYLQARNFSWFFTLILIVILIGSWVLFTFLRKISANMTLAFTIVDGIVAGKLQEQVQTQTKCNINLDTRQLLQSLDTMQGQLHESIAEVDMIEAKLHNIEKEKLFSNETVRKTIALDTALRNKKY